MKKFQIVILFLFLMGCASNQIVPTATTFNSVSKSSPLPSTSLPTQTSLPASKLPNTPNQIIASGKIAFSSDGEIYVMNADGSGQTNVSNYGKINYDPVWSPDGKKVAFDCLCHDNGKSNHEIHVVNADGTGQINLSNDIDTDDSMPVWSPDGTRIAFLHRPLVNQYYPYFEIYIMNADGSERINLTNNVTNDLDPAWSPDGKNIVFSSDRSGAYAIYVIGADGKGQVNLTGKSLDHYAQQPHWSPDGQRIVFVSDDGVDMINADGSGRINIFSSNLGYARNPTWSPDGKKIVFDCLGHNSNNSWEIYVTSADGSTQINLTNNNADDMTPAWSPDGKQIVFTSSRDGNFEIYTMNADGNYLKRLTHNNVDDYNPVWSP